MANWKEITKEASEAKALMLKNRRDGEEMFLELFKKYGNDGMIHFLRGEAYEGLGDYDLAVEDYRQAESLFPFDSYKDKARNSRLKAELHYSTPLSKNDPQPFFENVVTCIPKDFSDCLLSAQQSLDSGFPDKAIKEVGESGVRRVIMHLEKKNNLQFQAGSNWAARSRELEAKKIISSIVEDQLTMVREIRNKIANSDTTVTRQDALACLETFKSALISIFETHH